MKKGWTIKKLKEVGNCITGLTYSPTNVVDKDGMLVLRSSNIKNGTLVFDDNVYVNLEVQKDSQTRVNDILVCVRNGSRSLIGKSALISKEGTGVAHGAFMMLFRSNDFMYLYQLFQSSLYYKQVHRNLGATINSINSGNFYNFKFPFPPEDKRLEIASLLSTWDAAIEKTDWLIEAKEKKYKWLLNELIYKGSEKNGWNNVKLGELFNEVTEKVGEADIPPFSISAGVGFVSQKEKWGKDIAGKQYQNYVRIQKGEFAYNKGNSKKYKCGCAYLLKDHSEIAVPNVFISFKKKNKEICSDFYEHYFIADHHARELRKYISSSARSDGLLNLNKKDFFKILVPYPPAAKQRAIANTLSTARQEIELLDRLAETYKEQKRGLMQKLLTGQWRVKI